jgi:hypothetical protein
MRVWSIKRPNECSRKLGTIWAHGKMAPVSPFKSARYMVRKGGLEPPRFYPPDPKSGASANSATFALYFQSFTAMFFAVDFTVGDFVGTLFLFPASAARLCNRKRTACAIASC